jgi:hypothetical protein
MYSERPHNIEDEPVDRRAILEGWLSEVGGSDLSIEEHTMYDRSEGIVTTMKGGFYERISLSSNGKLFNKQEFQSKFQDAVRSLEKENAEYIQEQEEWNNERGAELNEWIKELGIEGLRVRKAMGGARGATEKLDIMLDGNEVGYLQSFRRGEGMKAGVASRGFTKEEFLDQVKESLNPQISNS